MKRIQRSALLPFPATHLFDLVNDIERYPEFLPWCRKAEIVSRQEQEVMASLIVRKGGIEHTFTTRNVARFPEQIDIHLVDGPFERLSGRWRFTDLQQGTAEGDGPVGCKIELDLQFEFSRHLLTGMFGSVASSAVNGLVDAFCVRAGELHQAGGPT